jgi:hypothetical protein
MGSLTKSRETMRDDEFASHLHSRLARYIVYSYAIGQIKSETFNPSMFDLRGEGVDLTDNAAERPVHPDRFSIVALESRRLISKEESRKPPVYLLKFKFENATDILNVRPGEHVQVYLLVLIKRIVSILIR